MIFEANKIKDEIVKWIRNYFEENGKNCNAVVGISGGKDSSVTAALCAQALGAEKVFGVLMPCGEQWDIDVSKDLAARLRIQYKVINIKNVVDSFSGAINCSGLSMNRQAEINTPARMRMAVLYAVSAIIDGRVANTCNLSEDWVGYSTKYGDSAGDFSPLSRLTVTEVISVGRQLGLSPVFTEKVPEDGLTGLTDEQNLGFSYETLDRYIRQNICEDKIIREKIDRLNRLNRHKLLLMPCYEYVVLF